jgi:hypothetical protein
MVTTNCLVDFLREFYPTYMNEYMATRNPESLKQKLVRFCKANGFSFKKPTTTTTINTEEMDRIVLTYSQSFQLRFGEYPRSRVVNVDETGVYFDSLPPKVIAARGKNESARCLGYSKQCGRVTVVLAVTADGQKLPPLIIFSGRPGGTIERNELPSYRQDVHYCCQQNAWMDGCRWQFYINTVLRQHL